MAINYASKYSTLVDEKFAKEAFTASAFNTDYDFTGVNTVNVYSIPTVAMGDYTMSGSSRYGTPTELEDEVQTLTLTQDRSFTFTIDQRNYLDTMLIKEAGRALSRQLTMETIPEVDTYRLATLVAGAGTTTSGTAITTSNAYEYFLQGVTTIMDNKAPLAGTFAFIGSNFYSSIRQDTSFIRSGDLSQNMLLKGQVGEIEGIPLIHVPASYLPTGTEFILTNKIAAWTAQKIADYKIHDNPPGINGSLVEGRIYYDCGILNNKKTAIYVHTA